MCFYYAVVKVNTDRLCDHQGISREQLNLFPDHFFVNGFDFPLMPVISDHAPGQIHMFRWGMVPATTRSGEEARAFLNKYNTLNARTESIFESRIYGPSIRTRRCLVLCSGFFEWRHREPGKKGTPKYPFYVTLKDNSMFVFAGVWNTFTDRETGEIIPTYSILTTPANPLVSLVHNSKKRMPLILPPEKAMEWLSPTLSEEKIKDFFTPFDASRMKARPIARINPYLTKSNNNPEVTAYYEYQELQELIQSHPGFFEPGADLQR
jgi:putative SOS response-associated peptidase YedK